MAGRNKVGTAGRRMLVAFGTVALVTLAPAANGSQNATREVMVTAELHDPGQPGFSNYGATCGTAAAGVCEVSMDGRVDWTGGWTGSSTYHSVGRPEAPGSSRMIWEVWETFTGTVVGCGTGTFTWYGTGTIDFGRVDPVTRTAPMVGQLELRDPTSGELQGIRGTLELAARMSLLPTFGEQRGTVSGTVRCAVGQRQAEVRPAGRLPRTGR